VDKVKTKILREPWDVDRRLAELRLTREGLLNVVAVALVEAANATPYHCANAAGTFSYQHGTWALRQEFVEGEWTLDRCDGTQPGLPLGIGHIRTKTHDYVRHGTLTPAFAGAGSCLPRSIISRAS
jgi:hypothetical protein